MIAKGWEVESLKGDGRAEREFELSLRVLKKSAADNHVDHSHGGTWIRWQSSHGGDHPVWLSVVSNRVATDRSIPR